MARSYHTQQKHLDLIALHQLVLLELVLNLLVAGLALLLLRAHSTTHFGVGGGTLAIQVYEDGSEDKEWTGRGPGLSLWRRLLEIDLQTRCG